MNKAELVEEVAAEVGLTKKDVNNVLDAMTSAITDSLARGEKITLVGFGTFLVQSRKARRGVNPQTGDKIEIVGMECGAEIDYREQPDGDMDDIVHPYQNPTTGEAPGYAKMADVWFSALEQILPDPDPDPDPPNNSSSSDSGCFIGSATY